MDVKADYTAQGGMLGIDGSWSWLNNQDLLHRVDGPAWISGVRNHQEWYLHGERHRADGPAIIDATGLQEWWLHGQRHRADGPAHIGPNGSQAWFRHGQRHRVDGPAIIRASGSRVWYVQERNITTEVEEWMQVHNITWPFTPAQQVEFLLRWG